MNDYTQFTEVSGSQITKDQLDRMIQRYTWASSLIHPGSEVLELCCGSGQGIGILSSKAKNITAVDVTHSLINQARGTYTGRDNIKLIINDAARYASECKDMYDTIVIFEAIYYIKDPLDLLADLANMLKPNGSILITWPNPGFRGFTPSQHSYVYPDEEWFHGLDKFFNGNISILSLIHI